MQAIQTKYHGPTPAREPRISATAWAGRRIVDYDHALNLEANHRTAAEALIAKMGWIEPGYGTLVSGCLADGSYCHVMTGRDGKGG